MGKVRGAGDGEDEVDDAVHEGVPDLTAEALVDGVAKVDDGAEGRAEDRADHGEEAVGDQRLRDGICAHGKKRERSGAVRKVCETPTLFVWRRTHRGRPHCTRRRGT